MSEASYTLSATQRVKARHPLDTTRLLPACADWVVPASPIDMWDWQSGRCAFCGWGDQRLVRDHDHDSGMIRGLLCSGCNTREPFASSPAWDAYRNGVNPAGILAQHEVWEPLSPTVLDQAHTRHRNADPAWQRHLAWMTL